MTTPGAASQMSLLDSVGRYHRAGPETEREAAESVADITGRHRREVLRLLAQAGSDGLTDDEGGALMGGDRLKFGRRRNEVAMKGLVVDSGRRRLTPAGRRAVVWVLS